MFTCDSWNKYECRIRRFSLKSVIKAIGIFCLALISFFIVSDSFADVIIHGAGATFPYPLYKKWMEVYEKTGNDRISYEAVGSGKGIKRLLEKSVDFAGTDAYMSDEEMSKVPEEILHIPTCIGAVVITYNLPENRDLRFTPGLIADIFSGYIKKWSDKRIADVNPKIKLPDNDITVVRRSDGSGTTFVLTEFLSKTVDDWKKNIGYGKQVEWLVGIGLEGNPAVADFIAKIPGSIGYVELTYALKNNFPQASIQNSSGNFIKPTLESISAAAELDLPKDTRIMLTNTSAPDGYPISAFTYITVYKEQDYDGRTIEQAKSLSHLLNWMIGEGQRYTNEMQYAPLPKEAIYKADNIIKSMTYKHKPVN